MFLQENIKEYITYVSKMNDEKREINENLKEFKASFAGRTGATKEEMKFLEKAVKLAEGLTYNEAADKFQALLSDVHNIMSTGSIDTPTSQTKEEEIQTELLTKITDKIAEVARAKAKSAEPVWNPPPAPVIPSSKK
jgi:hypothetical protein